MGAKMIQKEKTRYILLIAFGVLAIWLFVDHIANFRFPQYFYNRHPDIELYIGTNIVSAWADFSFFTYITLILWAFWAISYGICWLANCGGRFAKFIKRDTVVGFVFANYVLTAVLYTVFTLCSARPDFGFYANVPLGWHNLGTNLFVHYAIFIFSVFAFLNVHTERGQIKRALPCIISFAAVYYATVKLTGEFAYNIRWFPYVIFDAKSFGNMLGITNYAASVVLMPLLSLCKSQLLADKMEKLNI